MVTTNASGDHVLKPLVIGKAANPRAFKNRKHLLPVFWASNKKAWMNHQLMAVWIRDMFVPQVKERLMQRGVPRSQWKVLLALDNCPGHGSVDWMQKWCPDWLEIEMLPPNTTSVIQPMDGGIIMKLKRRYRRQLLRFIASMGYPSVQGFLRSFNMWHAVTLLDKAIRELTAEEIAIVWRRTIFGGALNLEEPSEEADEAERARRVRQEPGYWLREKETEEGVIKDIVDLCGQLEKCGIISDEIDYWLSVDEAISRLHIEYEGVSFDDALAELMSEAMDSVLDGVEDLDVTAAINGGEEDEEEEPMTEEMLSIQEVQKALARCADFFDRRASNPYHGQMCRDLAFEVYNMMVASRRQTSIEDFMTIE